jgi:hypothetical protein
MPIGFIGIPILEVQADLRAIEKSNGNQIIWLQKRLEQLVVSSKSASQQVSAEQLRKELADMSDNLKIEIASTKQPVFIQPGIEPSNPNISKKACRSDDLKDCTDEELLEWGKPLVESVIRISDSHQAALSALDNIKGNWAGFLFGKDKDSKWIKGYSEAQKNTADEFRNCCAESALHYHAELTARVAGGSLRNESYEWVKDLLSPIGSKGWKRARSDSDKITDIEYDLKRLQIDLDLKRINSKMNRATR